MTQPIGPEQIKSLKISTIVDAIVSLLPDKEGILFKSAVTGSSYVFFISLYQYTNQTIEIAKITTRRSIIVSSILKMF